MSASFDINRLGRIHEHLARRVHNKGIAGAAAIVARNGEVVLSDIQGYANLEEGIVLEKDSIFQLASMTKPIISVAILILIEEGKILLHDPLYKFIPEFRNLKVAIEIINDIIVTFPANRVVTIHDL